MAERQLTAAFRIDSVDALASLMRDFITSINFKSVYLFLEAKKKSKKTVKITTFGKFN